MNLRLLTLKIYRFIKRRVLPVYDKELKRIEREVKILSPKKGEILHLLELNKAYSKEYFSSTHFQEEESLAYKLSEIIYKVLKPKSVVDFGCGKGLFLKFFYVNGIKILGYEGSMNAFSQLVIPKNFVRHVDLRRAIEKPYKKFDLAISFEVAEHLEKEFAGTFVSNTVLHSDTVCFTACPPGLDDKHPHHPNEQPIAYWDKLFDFYGFKETALLTKQLQGRISKLRLPFKFRYLQKVKIYKKFS